MTASPLEADVVAETRLRALMWEKAGIVRTLAGLAEADEALAPFLAEGASHPPELRNLATTAHLIVRCAHGRRESRGLHWLEDHPWRDNEAHLRDTQVVRGPDGRARLLEGER